MHKNITGTLVRLLASNLFIYFLFITLNLMYSIYVYRPSISDNLMFGLLPVGMLRILIIVSMSLPYYGVYINISKSKKNIEANFKKYVPIFLYQVLIILIGLYLVVLEYYNFPNYVYSNYHIYIVYLQDLLNIFIFSIAFAIFVYIDTKTKTVQKMENKLKRTKLPKGSILIFISLIILFKSLLGLYRTLAADLVNINKVSKVNIPIKYYAYDLDQFSKKMYFVIQNTPVNATIFHPPQSWDYPDIGNQVLVRYFLYPRKLVSPKFVDEYNKNNTECNDYSLISESYKTKGIYYPDSVIEYDKMTLLLSDGAVREYYNNIYSSKEISIFKPVVGVIKHKTCGIY